MNIGNHFYVLCDILNIINTTNKTMETKKTNSITFDGSVYKTKKELFAILSVKYNLDVDTLRDYFLRDKIETTQQFENIFNSKKKRSQGNPRPVTFDGVEYTTKFELYNHLASITCLSPLTIQEYILYKNVETVEELKSLVRRKGGVKCQPQ
jgi:hypothetical protein